MNILFIGNSFPPKIYSTIIQNSKGKATLSLHNFEQSFLKGLSEQDDINIKVILVPWVGTYPISYTKLFVKPEKYNKDGLSVKSVGYCNLIGYNVHSREKHLYRQLIKTFEEFPEGDIHAIIDTFKYPMLKAFQKARAKSQRKITQTVIMMDMPGYEITKMKTHPLKRLLIKKDLDDTMRMVAESDYVVVLTKYFLDYFDRPMKHLVIEGMVNPETMACDTNVTSPKKKAVLYTGTLMKIYGVMNLVDAFEKANVKDAELWICGSGESEDEIVERSKRNPNIKYWGLLTSEEAWKKQREATVLVNPRTSDGEYTKYSFPSKTLEYLLSGRPVIVNRLPGLPDEYAEYCIFPQNESVDALAERIREILLKTEEERAKIGQKGKEFIMEKKNAKHQVGKIIELLKADTNHDKTNKK